MSEQEAEELLKKLSTHYNQPVMPLRRFCNAIDTWINCIESINRKEPDGRHQGSRYWKFLHVIRTDIAKSNLLARLLYGGEKLRTRECPEHKGSWGWSFEGCQHGCNSGCNITGFLPETEDNR